MNSLSLIVPNPKRLGRWCNVGAWSILVLGVLDVVLNITYAWRLYMQLQAQAEALTKAGQDASNNAFFPNLYAELYYLAGACQAAILPIFLFIVLYIAGTIFTALSASTAPTPNDTEDIVYESLKIPAKVRE